MAVGVERNSAQPTQCMQYFDYSHFWQAKCKLLIFLGLYSQHCIEAAFRRKHEENVDFIFNVHVYRPRDKDELTWKQFKRVLVQGLLV